MNIAKWANNANARYEENCVLQEQKAREHAENRKTIAMFLIGVAICYAVLVLVNGL